MYFRRKTSAGRAYLQIVASRRAGDLVRQQVIATLGRFEGFAGKRPAGAAVALGRRRPYARPPPAAEKPPPQPPAWRG